MSAPREALKIQSVKIRYVQRLTTGTEPTIPRQAVTNVVKRVEGTDQTATKVKVLSSEIYDVIEADVFHYAESCTKGDTMVSRHLLYRGLSPWYEMRWSLGELGRSSVFPQGYAVTSQQRREVANDTEEVGLIDSTLSLGKPSTWGSFQQWSDCSRGGQTNTQILG